MIITDESHDFTCTDCRHTGRPCMEAIWLSRKLVRSLGQDASLPDQEITSSARFIGCGFPCEASVRIAGADVQVFCGIESAETPIRAGLPRAMVLAAPAAGQQVDQQHHCEQRRA